MQTSFMHPPFGFALFYLRSVAPAHDYMDKLTGKRTPGVTTGQIYWGAIPFVVIQVVMVALLIAFPQMSLVYKSGAPEIDMDKVKIEIPTQAPDTSGSSDIMKDLGGAPPLPDAAPDKAPAKTPEQKENDELMKQLGGGK
jgi:hypothetical protein